MSARGVVEMVARSDEPYEAAVVRLAKLSPIDYDRVRDAEAQALKCRVTTLDAEVDKARAAAGGNEANEQAAEFPAPEPWPEPVDGTELLASIAGEVRRYLVLSSPAADAVALWVVHAHAHDAAEHSPILAVTSPQKRCGKTTLLSVLQHLLPRPLPTSNITASAIFRSVEKWRPTLLIDEADTFLRDSEELRGVLNSGHSRTSAFVVRTTGEDHEPRRFMTWAPKAIALIGTLPETLADRSIEVRLQRRLPSETVGRFRERTAKPDLEVLCRKAARWIGDTAKVVEAADPAIPDMLHDRAQDNWRPLIAIADVAGGEWPERARKAAFALSVGDTTDNESVHATLLADIRTIFDERGVDRMKSVDLANELARIEGRPWAEWKGRQLTANGLARLLKPFGIHPSQVRFGAETMKGYQRSDLDDAFARYSPVHIGTTETLLKTKGNSGFRNETRAPDVSVVNAEKRNEINRVSDVSDHGPQSQRKGENQPATQLERPRHTKVSL